MKAPRVKHVLVDEIQKMLTNTKHTFSENLSVDLVTLLNVGTTDLKSSSHDQRHLPVGQTAVNTATAYVLNDTKMPAV